MQKKLLPVFLLVFPLFLMAQTDSIVRHPNFLVLGVNAGWLSTQDQNQSSLIFYGIGGGLNIGFYREGQKFTQMLNIQNLGAMAIPLGDNINSSYSVFLGRADYGLLSNSSKSWRNWHFKYGGFWHNKAIIRMHSQMSNNALSYDVLSGIDAAFSAARAFRFWRHSFLWENQWRASIFSFSLEPAYSYPAPKGFTQLSDNSFQSVIKSFKLFSFVGAPALEWESKVAYQMHNQNRWEIFHHWQFHQINMENKRFAAFHSAGIKLYFNL